MKTNKILKKYQDYIKNYPTIQSFNYFVGKDNNIEKSCFKLHDDVNQTYDGNPYSLHLRMVSDYVCSVVDKAVDCKLFCVYDSIEAEKCRYFLICYYASLLHDSIEDARLTFNDVIKFCDENISIKSIPTKSGDLLDIDSYMIGNVVYAVTNEKGKNRKERANEKYYEGIRNNHCAIVVKICDRLANMKYSYLMGSKMMDVYEKELDNFIESVIPKHNYLFRDAVIEMFNEIKFLKNIHE